MIVKNTYIGKTLVCLCIGTLFIFNTYAVDDVDEVNNRVNILKNTSDSNLPNISNRDKKGSIANIISRLFDNTGKIRSIFIYAFSNLTSGNIPVWVGDRFENSIVSQSGSQTNIAGDIDIAGDIYQNNTTFGKDIWEQSGTDLYYLSGSTNVGIGTSQPNSKLDVEGSIGLGSTLDPCSSSKAGSIKFEDGLLYICTDKGVLSLLGNGPANDGDLLVNGGGTSNINIDLISSGRAYADGIAYRVDAPNAGDTTVSSFSISDVLTNGIAVGDEVMIINLQGVSGDSNDVGNYEFARVESITSDSITFEQPITKSYSGNTASSQKVVIQRVPLYASVNLSNNSIITSGVFDGLATTPAGSGGYTTGIVAFKTLGDIVIDTDSQITVTGLGYKGGNGANVGQKGESYNPSTNSYAGGGGANVYDCNSGNHGGNGSHTYGVANLSKMFFGPGGGGGATGDGPGGVAPAGDGGKGGGIIHITAQGDIQVLGGIYAYSGDPTPRSTASCTQPDGNVRTVWGGVGGNGAGGSILLQAINIDAGSNNIDATLVGNDGRIALYYSSGGTISGTTLPISNNYTY